VAKIKITGNITQKTC